MADMLIRLNGTDNISEHWDELCKILSLDSKGQCFIYGKIGTFCVIREGVDVIASIGYVCHVGGDSVQATLSKILRSFDETQIGTLKKTLVGQYVLLIKKGDSIYLFSDFMGTRNIFYSDDGKVISTSFSKAENLLGTSASDLDTYKVFEFLAMRHIFYPSWLGRTTEHRRIKWLLPYEYLVVDTANSSYRLGSVVYSIDNKKQSDCSFLADELLSRLKAIINRREFKDVPVAASLTGGRDSRLVAAIAAEQFRNIRFRTAVSLERVSSSKDLEVADRIAKLRGIPLDIYTFQAGRDDKRFIELTEGFTPAFNHSISPLIDSAGSYSLGLGGVYGTELFIAIPWNKIDGYIQQKVENAKQSLKVEDSFWNNFCGTLHDEFRRTKEHFQLSDGDERDYIRLFNLLNTVRYSSFILSAFNRAGYQLEPYGNYAILELALRVAPALWGNHRRLGGDALVQKAAMANLDPRLAKIMTYSSFRPMTPFSLPSVPFYLMGFTIQVAYWLRERFEGIKKKPIRTVLPEGYYISDGWEKHFIDRTVKKYGLSVQSSR